MKTLPIIALSIAFSLYPNTIDTIVFKPVHLFSLNADQAEVSYRKRPTPCLAVDSNGNIAFPTREYEIGVFSPEGRVLHTITDSTVNYPKKMLFDEKDFLQIMDLAEKRIIKYYNHERRVYSLSSQQDWWRYSDTRIAEYLDVYKPTNYVWQSYDRQDRSHVALTKSNQLIDIFFKDDRIYIDGADFEVYDRLTKTRKKVSQHIGWAFERIFGVFKENFVLITREYYPRAYVFDVTNGTEKKIDFASVLYKYELPNGSGNSPETNKLNRMKDWFWQRNTNNIYIVNHTPGGFTFLKLSISDRE